MIPSSPVSRSDASATAESLAHTHLPTLNLGNAADLLSNAVVTAAALRGVADRLRTIFARPNDHQKLLPIAIRLSSDVEKRFNSARGSKEHKTDLHQALTAMA